jgi:uncharacterized protein YjiS (DUF1127 family)
MRITHDLYHSASPSALDMPEAEMERRSMDLRAACNPSLSGQFETSDPHVAPYSTGTGAARGPMARAISWLAACVLEGLAAYGEGMYPGFADPGERLDYRNTETTTQPRSDAQSEHEDGGLLLRPTTGSPVGQEHGTRRAGVARVWIMSPVGRSWSWMRREWEVGRTIAALQKLDDRTLKDVGLNRCQIESVVRYAYRYDA